MFKRRLNPEFLSLIKKAFKGETDVGKCREFIKAKVHT